MTSPLASDQCTWRGSHDYKVTAAVFPCWCNYSYKPRSYRSRNLLSWHCSGTMECCLSLKQKSGEKFRFLHFMFSNLNPLCPNFLQQYPYTIKRKGYENWLTLSLPNLAKSKFQPNVQISFCEILKNKTIAPCVSIGSELSFEWSHHTISSTDSKVTVTLQNSNKHSGSESVRGSPEGKSFDF